MKLHEAMVEVLRRHGGGWVDRDQIAKEIAAEALFVRPSDGLPPPSDQLRLRARSKAYSHLFVCSDTECTRIRLRDGSREGTVGAARAPVKRPGSAAHGKRVVGGESTSSRIGARAAALARLLALAGRAVGTPGFDRPNSRSLPGTMRAEVLDTYRRLGGVQADPLLSPGSWDMGCDGIAIELDEDLHFNRYRGVTLAGSVYESLPNFPLERYRRMCRVHEDQCLMKGRGQARWTSPSTERQFGSPAPRGVLSGNGAPRWKQRALYDFMKDLAPLAGLGTVSRIAVWDVVHVNGSVILIDSLLRAAPDKGAARAVCGLVDSRAGRDARHA